MHFGLAASRIVEYRRAALIRGEVLISGRRLFQCGYQKVHRLSEGITYLRPSAY